MLICCFRKQINNFIRKQMKTFNAARKFWFSAPSLYLVHKKKRLGIFLIVYRFKFRKYENKLHFHISLSEPWLRLTLRMGLHCVKFSVAKNRYFDSWLEIMSTRITLIISSLSAMISWLMIKWVSIMII